MNQIIKTPTEITKAAIKEIAAEIISSVEDGYNSALDLQIQAKFLEEVLKIVKKDNLFKKEALNELDKYEKRPVIKGVEISKRSTTKYEYCSAIKQVEKEFEEDIEETLEFIKSLKDKAKKLKEGALFSAVHPATGEMITITNAIKKSSETILVKLK